MATWVEVSPAASSVSCSERLAPESPPWLDSSWEKSDAAASLSEAVIAERASDSSSPENSPLRIRVTTIGTFMLLQAWPI